MTCRCLKYLHMGNISMSVMFSCSVSLILAGYMDTYSKYSQNHLWTVFFHYFHKDIRMCGFLITILKLGKVGKTHIRNDLNMYTFQIHMEIPIIVKITTINVEKVVCIGCFSLLLLQWMGGVDVWRCCALVLCK